MEDQLEQLKSEMASLKSDVAMYVSSLETRKQEFSDQVNLEFANPQIAIDEVVEGAKADGLLIE